MPHKLSFFFFLQDLDTRIYVLAMYSHHARDALCEVMAIGINVLTVNFQFIPFRHTDVGYIIPNMQSLPLVGMLDNGGRWTPHQHTALLRRENVCWCTAWLLFLPSSLENTMTTVQSQIQ